MKPIILVLAIVFLTSCSRYQYLPRATVKNIPAIKTYFNILKEKSPEITGHSLTPQSAPIGLSNLQKKSWNEVQKEEESSRQKGMIQNPVMHKIKALNPTVTIVRKSSGTAIKPTIYQVLGRIILLSILVIIVGGIMVAAESEAVAITGGILATVGVLAFMISLWGIFFSFLGDLFRGNFRKSPKTVEGDKTSQNKNKDTNDNEQPTVETKSEAKNDELPKEVTKVETTEESKKEDVAKATTKEESKPKEQPENKFKNMFISLLISNIVVWAVARIKIDK